MRTDSVMRQTLSQQVDCYDYHYLAGIAVTYGAGYREYWYSQRNRSGTALYAVCGLLAPAARFNTQQNPLV